MEQIEETVKPKRTRKKVVAVSANSETGKNEVETQEVTAEKNQEQFTEAVAEIQDPKKAIQAYINDPHVSENVRKWCEALESQFGKKWFTAKDAAKNRRADATMITQIMTVAILKGMAHQRTYGYEGNESMKFQITLQPVDKIARLREELDIIENKKKELSNQQEAIKKQIEIFEGELIKNVAAQQNLSTNVAPIHKADGTSI